MEGTKRIPALKNLFYIGKTRFPLPRFTKLEQRIKKIPKLGFLKRK